MTARIGINGYGRIGRVLHRVLLGRGERRMRAAGQSIVPTTTGASRAVAQVLPGLQGRLDGIALRVPVPDGSIVDFVATLRRGSPTVQEVNDAFLAAARDQTYRGVLTYTDQALVSADIIGNPASCIFSATDTMAGGHMVKVAHPTRSLAGAIAALIADLEQKTERSPTGA